MPRAFLIQWPSVTIFPGHEDTMHQANEHITEDDLEAGCRIYAKAMIRLGNL